MPAAHSGDGRRTARPPVKDSFRAAIHAKTGKRIGSIDVLYAHALQIEREAAGRYREFASYMAERGDDDVATLFGRLAEVESEQASRLEEKTVGMTLPRFAPGEHAWFDRESPVPEAHAFIYRMLTPRVALQIALSAEERAKAFYESVLAEASDGGVRKIAFDMARDEAEQISRMNEALARVPLPYQPSEEQPGDPTIPQAL